MIGGGGLENITMIEGLEQLGVSGEIENRRFLS